MQAVRAHGDAAEGLGRHGGHQAAGRAHHAHREGLERRAQRHPHRPRAHRSQRAERGHAQGTHSYTLTPTRGDAMPNALSPTRATVDARRLLNAMQTLAAILRYIFACISYMLQGKRNLFSLFSVSWELFIHCIEKFLHM